MNIIKILSLNTKLALVAAFLGVIAIISGNPYSDKKNITIDAASLAIITQKGVSEFPVITLAEWIIAGKSDYRIIDLRDEKSFDDYHIPSSENIQPASLIESGLLRNEKIILYSDDDVRTTQAWFLLEGSGFKSCYILKGGLNAWQENILFPDILKFNNNADKIEKFTEISKFFGGNISSGSDKEIANTKKPVMPKPDMPAPVGGTKKTGKPKRQGC